MAAALFPARTQARSIARPPTRRATSPRTLSARDWPERCTIQVAYAIGVSKPLSLYVDLHGTGDVDEGKLEVAMADVIDLTPRGIRQHLGLNKPIFARTAAYGHFGREPDADGGFSWERLDLADKLKAALN